ncbi:MAG: SUMF1/EgtB/PvdO family nonheme iron enzyme [Myxococcales bacterium]|nr:SUMF1/EgtB/PvdO family nonheme iron enzyme [Myxococcales bacterium]
MFIFGCATDTGARGGLTGDILPITSDVSSDIDIVEPSTSDGIVSDVILPEDSENTANGDSSESIGDPECPPNMVYIPSGSFIMGDVEGNPDAKIQHEVTLDAYCIDIYEVSVAEYQKCADANACTDIREYALCLSDAPDRPNSCQPDRKTHPVNYVSWNLANQYCTWARKTLPTEAQWEQAARGNDFRSYPWGETANCEIANWGHGPVFDDCDYLGPTTPTMPVDSYPDGASFYGVLNMGGNVDEWVSDWYDPKYYEVSPPRNPTGPTTGEWRVFRGGSFSGPNFVMLSYWRQAGLGPQIGSQNSGFRCAAPPRLPAK